METPLSQRLRLCHIPTPRMSDRKKSLFTEITSRSPITSVREDSDLGPMSPLKFNASPERFRKSPVKASNKVTSFRNIFGNISPNSDRSLSPDYEKRFSHSDRYELFSGKHQNKENVSNDDETRLSFNNNNVPLKKADLISEMALLDENNSNSLSHLMTVDLNLSDKKLGLKTPGITESQKSIPKLSFRKTNLQDNGHTPNEHSPEKEETESDKKAAKARTSLSFTTIPTKSFYSSSTTNKAISPASSPAVIHPTKVKKPNKTAKSTAKVKKRKIKKRPSVHKNMGMINRGVFHNIFREKKTIKKKSAYEKAMDIINNSKVATFLEKYKKEDSDKAQMERHVQRLKNIFKNSKNPIEMARPLSLSKSMTDLNNESSDEDEELEASFNSTFNESHSAGEKNDEDEALDVTKGKKFFKSAPNKRLNRQYKLMNNLSATVKKGGKISLNKTATKKRKLKSLFDEDFDFESEQTEVLDIIKKLEQSAESADSAFVRIQQRLQMEKRRAAAAAASIDVSLEEEMPTIPPNPIPQQPAPSTGEDVQMSPTTQISNMTSELALTSRLNIPELINLHSSPQDSPKLFPLFYKGQCQAESQPTSPVDMFESARKRQKKMPWKPIGSDQYQIDAGQKNYGATKCPECGLVYSAHEPEEELMHQNYHQSLHILKFNGWTNEIVVAEVPEWGVTGRIICVAQNEPKAKLNRLDEILKVVNQELGYGAAEQKLAGLHEKSFVYLAIGRSIILGACVVEPVKEAYRIITLEGVEIDCWSAESYPVKCGVSRIWVAAQYRRNGVAKTIMAAVKSHFVFGYYMSYDEIAFSAPTEAGKALAESLTQRKDFLVYQ